MTDKLYTKNVALDIVLMFDELLDKHGIKIPSPEDGDDYDINDEERAPLYGSVFDELLNSVEDVVKDAVIKAVESNGNVVFGEWGD